MFPLSQDCSCLGGNSVQVVVVVLSCGFGEGEYVGTVVVFARPGSADFKAPTSS